MSEERRLAHSGFTLIREYPAPVAHVWRAFAEEGRKRQWFGDGDSFDRTAWAFDFRVGGRDDGTHMSTSLASFEFEPIPAGTRLTQVEHGVFFDRFWADAPQREEGMRGLLDELGNHLG